MSTILNYPRSVAAAYGNTGQPSANVSLDKLVGLILTTDGYEIPLASLATWEDALAYLQDSTLAPNKKDRAFPVMFVEGLTDNTPEANKVMSGYGNIKKIVENPFQASAEMENLGIEWFKNLRKFKDMKNLRGYWVDTTFIGGELTSTGLKGFECSFMVGNPKIGNGKDSTTDYAAAIEFRNPTALTDDINVIVYPKGVNIKNELFGCLDVELSSPTLNVVKAVEKISKVDMYDNYADELAVVGAWVATDSLTGRAIAISGVAKNTTYKGWTITHAAATGDTIITLASPDVLAGLNVGSATAGGYEAESGVSLGE